MNRPEFVMRSILIARRRRDAHVLVCKVVEVSRAGRLIVRPWAADRKHWGRVFSIPQEDILTVLPKDQDLKDLARMAERLDDMNQIRQLADEAEETIVRVRSMVNNRMTDFLAGLRSSGK